MAARKAPATKPATNDRNKALEVALSQIDKQFGKGSVMRLGDDNRPPVQVIPTGSLALDVALGIGGLPRGRVIEVYGPESSGKTTVALHAVANAQKAGGNAAFIDAEHALDPVYARALGVDSCSVALTYDRRSNPARVGAGERYALAVALGFGEKPGSAHPVKPVERLCRVSGEAPAWFTAGVEAARLAPTALNQQRFRFELLEDGRTVRARALPALSCGRVDLGIARLHFELGANAVSRDWAFER